jgi:hypothetical protein
MAMFAVGLGLGSNGVVDPDVCLGVPSYRSRC